MAGSNKLAYTLGILKKEGIKGAKKTMVVVDKKCQTNVLPLFLENRGDVLQEKSETYPIKKCLFKWRETQDIFKLVIFYIYIKITHPKQSRLINKKQTLKLC